MQSLIRLKHIVAVARSNSFSIAAEDAGISQPALSRSIQTFEAEYGLRLFDRGKGGVSLTPAGKLAVEHARGLLAAAGEFDREMRLFGQGNAGRTGIGMGPMVANLLLPELGVALLKQNPKLTLVTKVGSPDQMLDALLEGTIELIIGNSAQLSMVPGVTEQRLGILPLNIIVRAGHPLTATQDITIRDLDHYPIAQPFDHTALSQAHSSGAFVCENFGVLKQVVLQTDCIWLATPGIVSNELASGELVARSVKDLPITSTQINMVYQRDRTRSPASLMVADAAKALIEAVAKP